MEIKYKFVNGEETSISVYGEFEKIILELDRNLYNNNHAETRRHVSLSVFDEGKKVFTDIDTSFEEQLSNQVDKEVLCKAISKLKPDEQELIYKIYLNEGGVSLSDYAQFVNVSENAIKQRLKRIRKKLKSICSNTRLFCWFFCSKSRT